MGGIMGGGPSGSSKDPSKTEKAGSEVATQTFRLVAPIKDRVLKQLDDIISSPEAFSKHLAGKRGADFYHALARTNKVSGGVGYDKVISNIGSNNTLVQALSLINEEAKKQAESFADKAKESIGAISTEQQMAQMDRAGKYGSVFTEMAAEQMFAKAHRTGQIVSASTEAAANIGYGAYRRKTDKKTD